MDPTNIQQSAIVTETDIPVSLLEKLGFSASSRDATFQKPNSPKKFIIKPKPKPVAIAKRKPGPKVNVDPVRRFLCNSCPRQFTGYRMWFEHQQNHIPGYVCQFCKIRFGKREELKNHSYTHNEELQFRRIPSKTYSGQRSVIKSRICVAPAPGENSLIGLKPTGDDFKAKLRRTYSALTNSQAADGGVVDRSERLYREIEPRIVFNHVSREYVNAKFQCSLCGGVASKENSMKMHVSWHSRARSSRRFNDTTALLQFACSDCSFSTSNETELKVHQLSHAPDINLQKIPSRTYSRKVPQRTASDVLNSSPSALAPSNANSALSKQGLVSTSNKINHKTVAQGQSTTTTTCNPVPQFQNKSTVTCNSVAQFRSTSTATCNPVGQFQNTSTATCNQSVITREIKREISDPPTAVALVVVLNKEVGDGVGTSNNVATDTNMIVPDFPSVKIKQEPLDYEEEEQQSEEEILP